MKKWICILLMTWLPCFMVVANAMGMQMALQNAATHTMQNEVPVHAHMACHQVESQDKTSKTASHHCALCAYCVVGSALATAPSLKMVHIKKINTLPLSFDVAIASQDYPPAIKPPILN